MASRGGCTPAAARSSRPAAPKRVSGSAEVPGRVAKPISAGTKRPRSTGGAPQARQPAAAPAAGARVGGAAAAVPVAVRKSSKARGAAKAPVAAPATAKRQRAIAETTAGDTTAAAEQQPTAAPVGCARGRGAAAAASVVVSKPPKARGAATIYSASALGRWDPSGGKAGGRGARCAGRRPPWRPGKTPGRRSSSMHRPYRRWPHWGSVCFACCSPGSVPPCARLS